ncbi:MAG: pyroglutamyl-peptidase I [Candidatus Heimdallarchaeota archaeon]|nr:pyroglutamyl-peptidase I [Candidatus Heimdallarchaeota archaeon]MDH5645350.1 pyroglutamyl-peptidase I [Candidatus Heimdallarchaeota archaeon]
MNILFTGFEPFGDSNINPTEEAVREMDGSIIGNHHQFRVIGKVIPLRYHEIRNELSKLIKEFKPVAILLSGQAGGEEIRLEKNAYNESTSKVPYNCGTIVNNEILVTRGPKKLTSILPLELFNRRLNIEKIPVKYSENAGRFGCNQIFYYARYDHPNIPSGFIHVPLLPQQAKKDQPSMTQETINRGLFLIISELANYLSINLIA